MSLRSAKRGWWIPGLLAVAHLFVAAAFGAGTSPVEGPVAAASQSRRIVAVGDIHGAFDELTSILMAAWEDEVAKVWLFDYLAYNIDRTPENLLLVPGFGVKLIDHSRAFQRFLVPMRPLMRFPRQAIERLRALADDEIREALSDYLTGEEIEALLTRRRRVLDRVDGLLATRSENEVLF